MSVRQVTARSSLVDCRPLFALVAWPYLCIQSDFVDHSYLPPAQLQPPSMQAVSSEKRSSPQQPQQLCVERAQALVWGNVLPDCLRVPPPSAAVAPLHKYKCSLHLNARSTDSESKTAERQRLQPLQRARRLLAGTWPPRSWDRRLSCGWPNYRWGQSTLGVLWAVVEVGEAVDAEGAAVHFTASARNGVCQSLVGTGACTAPSFATVVATEQRKPRLSARGCLGAQSPRQAVSDVPCASALQLRRRRRHERGLTPACDAALRTAAFSRPAGIGADVRLWWSSCAARAARRRGSRRCCGAAAARLSGPTQPRR
eukprot:scaffold3065_cov389-Prasinococcus_capsulatus_cf.AAC.9